MPNHCDAPLPDTHSRCRRRGTTPDGVWGKNTTAYTITGDI